ncbi:MAG: hypothetical protein IKC10_08575 [Alphaproteobacteria bacterium]|nr:hypothetical protein [Alphaproteobacteria bacterium]
MADNETFTFESAKEFFEKGQYADELGKMSNKDLMALNEALYDGNKVGEGELATMRELVNGEEFERLEKYAKADLSSYKEEELEDILALAVKHDADQGNYVDFAKEIINKVSEQKKSLEDQQQKESSVDSNESEKSSQPSQDGDQGGDQGEGSETDGNEDAVKKAEQALDDFVFEKYKWSKHIQYNDYEEMPTIVKEGDYEAFFNDYAKNNPEDEDYKKLVEALEEAKGTKPQQQENSEVKTYTAEELRTLMHNQTNALYNREGFGAEHFDKFHEEGRKILEAFVKGEVNVDSSAYTEMSGFINVFAGGYGDNNDEMKKLYDAATNKLESIKAEAENKNDQENETNEQKENSVDSNESEKSSQPSQRDSDQGGDQGDSDQGGDQGEGSEADKTEQKDHPQNSDQGIEITRDNALDMLNKQFHRLRPEEIIKLREIIKEDHNDQLNNLDKKIIDKTQTFLAGETVILQTSQLYHLDNLLDSVREDNKDDGKGSTNQIGLSAANLKNEVGQRIKDFEELYGLDEQSRVDDEQIAKNVELLKDLPSFERVTYKESEAIAAERVSNVASRSTKHPPQMEDIVGALKSEGLEKVDEERLLDLAVAKIKDVKKADLTKNEDIADFQYLLGAVKKSRPKVKVGKQEKLLFNAKKEYEKNHKNEDLSKDLQDAYDVLDRITVIGGTDPYGKRKVKGQEAEDIKNTFKEQCRLETEMFFANTNKGEKIDPKEFEKEYALRLQTGLLKLVNYEEASKLTAMKEGGEKDIAKAFENAFDSKKKIKISTVAFSAYHATEQDAINTVCQKSPKALSAYASSKNNSIKDQNKSQLKRSFSLGKGLLESAAWGAAFGVASMAPPLGVAIVAGASFGIQTYKLIRDFKQIREQNKQQGREYKFKNFVKENKWRMAGYALSAASTVLAGSAAIPGANAALALKARSATMMVSLGIGVKTTISNMKKAKSWKEKLLIGGTFVASIAVARFAGKSVQEVVANFGDPVVPDAISGADKEQPAGNQQLDSQNLSEFEQEISNLSEKELASRYSQITGKNPEGMSIEQMQNAIMMSGQDAYEAVLDRNNDGIMDGLDKDNDSILDSVDKDHGQGWATANETQIDRAFDVDPKGINEALKELNPEHKWMNSDQLHEMMEKGQFNDDQLRAIHEHASSHFDQQGHITDPNLKEFYEERAAEQDRSEEQARREASSVDIERLEPRRLDSIPVEEPEITLKTKSDLDIVEVEELDIKGGTRVKVEGESILGDAYSDQMKLDASVKAEISEQGLAGVGKIDVDKYVFNDNETITIEGDRVVAGVKQDIVSVINKEGQYISVTVNDVPVPQEQLDTFNNNPEVLESNSGIYAKVTGVRDNIEDNITDSMVEEHTGIKPNTTNTDPKVVTPEGGKGEDATTSTNPKVETQKGGNDAGANIGKHISELSKKGVNNKLESDTEIGKEKGTNPSLNKTNSYSSNNGSGGKGVYGINPNLNKGSTR